MNKLEKLKHFESLNRSQVITDVYLYIDNKVKNSNIYSLIDIPTLLEKAIRKLLNGTHAWDIKNDPNPTKLLGQNIWKEICHEMERRRKNKDYKSFQNPVDLNFLSENPLIENIDLLDEIVEIEEDKIWKSLKEQAEKENEDAWYYLLTMEDLYKKNKKVPRRSQIAEHMNVNVEKVSQIKRWIQRHYQEKVIISLKGASQ